MLNIYNVAAQLIRKHGHWQGKTTKGGIDVVTAIHDAYFIVTKRSASSFPVIAVLLDAAFLAQEAVTEVTDTIVDICEWNNTADTSEVLRVLDEMGRRTTCFWPRPNLVPNFSFMAGYNG